VSDPVPVAPSPTPDLVPERAAALPMINAVHVVVDNSVDDKDVVEDRITIKAMTGPFFLRSIRIRQWWILTRTTTFVQFDRLSSQMVLGTPTC